MPWAERLLKTSGNVSFLPSPAAVKTIFCFRKSICATAYMCPENETHFRDSEPGRFETQFDVPAAALEDCHSCPAKMAIAATKQRTSNQGARFFIAHEFTLRRLYRLTITGAFRQLTDHSGSQLNLMSSASIVQLPPVRVTLCFKTSVFRSFSVSSSHVLPEGSVVAKPSIEYS